MTTKGGFFSYIKYKKCFEFAYGRNEPGSVECTRLVTINQNIYRTVNDELFCVQSE